MKVLKQQGTWAWEQKPLLDEYVHALRAAEQARAGFAWLDHLEEVVAREEVDWMVLRSIASGLPTQWDRHTKRAQLLARTLVLTPEARKRYGLIEEEGDKDAFARFAGDELAQRRRRSKAG